MKAVRVHRFGGPEVLQLEEVPKPEPGPGQVRVRVEAIGVNPVETYQRGGSNPGLQLPWTPGTDAAGVADALGSGCDGFKEGDRVYTSDTLTGAYAGFVLCRAVHLHRLPSTLSFAQGAAINIPYATAHRALLDRAGARTGEVVLIHGASGGVGIAATQIARAHGLRIIATAGTEAGRRLAGQQGAHHVLDHHQPAYREEILRLTAGRGVDILLEMLANVNLGVDLPLLAVRGRVIVIGSRGSVEINPRELMKRDADVRGMMLFNASDDELAAVHLALGAGLEGGVLRPVVRMELPLGEAARAHEAVMAPGALGKIVLKP